MHNPIPAEHWFKQGRAIAYCQVKLKWMAAPGYRLLWNKLVYHIDGEMFSVNTVDSVYIRFEDKRKNEC